MRFTQSLEALLSRKARWKDTGKLSLTTYREIFVVGWQWHSIYWPPVWLARISRHQWRRPWRTRILSKAFGPTATNRICRQRQQVGLQSISQASQLQLMTRYIWKKITKEKGLSTVSGLLRTPLHSRATWSLIIDHHIFSRGPLQGPEHHFPENIFPKNQIPENIFPNDYFPEKIIFGRFSKRTCFTITSQVSPSAKCTQYTAFLAVTINFHLGFVYLTHCNRWSCN